ncbi:MAG TPA: EamA family transporter [Pyrinomonadaceae bacterium]|nr:EamA family transporter [Pyrinomonadaceae bacterium]
MKARIVWLVLALIWGSTWLFIKIGLEDLPPLSFAGIRFVLASLILGGIVAARRSPLPRRKSDWLLIISTGVLAFALNYGLLFWGEQHVSSGLAALLQATIPVFGLLIAHLYLPGERLTAAKVAGVLLGVAGVGVVFSNQLEVAGPKALWGSAAIVLGAVFVAFSNVLVKARGEHLDRAQLAAGQMVCGLVPLVVVGWATEGSPFGFNWTARAVVSLLYLTVVGSVVAFLLFYWLVRNMDVTKTMLIALITPLFAVLLGMAVLGERLTWRTLAGGALILSGIASVVWRRLRGEEKKVEEAAKEEKEEEAPVPS